MERILNWKVAFVCVHFESGVKNSRVRKSGKELLEPLRNSISKSKTERMACHLSKICLDAIFWTSFSRINLADWQSMRRRNFLFKRSSWNLEMHWTMESISFLIVEYDFWGPSQMPEWNLTNYSCDECMNLCFSMPPYPILDASVSTIMNAWG